MKKYINVLTTSAVLSVAMAQAAYANEGELQDNVTGVESSDSVSTTSAENDSPIGGINAQSTQTSSFVDESLKNFATQNKKIGYIDTNTLNVRNSPTTSGSIIIDSYKLGEKVEILEVSGDWGKINYKDTFGYVHMGYLLFEEGVDMSATPAIKTAPGTVNTSSLNVRHRPSAVTGDIVGKVTLNEIVQVIGITGDWAKIFYKDGIAFVHKSYITFKDASGNVTTPTFPDANTPIYFVETKENGKQMVGGEKQALLIHYGTKSEAVVYKDEEVIYMKDGLARTKAFTLVYDVNTNASTTYLTNDIDMDVLAVDKDKVIISFAGATAYVKKTDVELIPYLKKPEMAHFVKQGNDLFHKLFRNGRYESYRAGKAPAFLIPGVPYYSFDGHSFNGHDVHQYFAFTSARTETPYTGAELDAFIKAKSPDSPLIGYGQTFVDAAKEHDLNALYLLAHAIHESAWGKSAIAVSKNNLFGFRATDDDPANNATAFATMEEGIFYCAGYIDDKYLTPGGWIYKGSILGNKAIGMNVKYASDPYWGAKISNYMRQADEILGNKENNRYQLGTIDKATELYYIKDGQSTAIPKVTSLRYVTIKDTVATPFGQFYQLFSDDTTYDYIYVKPEQLKKITTY